LQGENADIAQAPHLNGGHRHRQRPPGDQQQSVEMVEYHRVQTDDQHPAERRG